MRIIPARAGFTRRQDFRRRGPQDHPRSRGVYSQQRSSSSSRPGSSPLARGLLIPRFPGRAGGRIIPARAGFTPPFHCTGKQIKDHPRSRGVYQSTWTGISGEEGSSPLARGLHKSGQAYGTTSGIIPARAGFTAMKILYSHSRKDHPRSRGVYEIYSVGLNERFGSSPLARGLPVPRIGGWLLWGIIPARAGFTCPSSS